MFSGWRGTSVVGRALARYYGVPAIGPGMTPPPDTIPAPPQPEAMRAVFTPETPAVEPPEEAPAPAPPPQ